MPPPDQLAIGDAATLDAIAIAEAACTRCPLFRDATQAVPGAGPADSPVVIVGEQPGDREDMTGEPFVGPAGRMLDKALGEAGIRRGALFVTNAVKHFKHEQRGKRRLHAKPSTSEIDACRWWLDRELAIVRPALTVALGATAARGLTGRTVKVMEVRGSILEAPPRPPTLVTIHPSLILRLRTPEDREAELRRFVADLRIIAERVPAVSV